MSQAHRVQLDLKAILVVMGHRVDEGPWVRLGYQVHRESLGHRERLEVMLAAGLANAHNTQPC